MACRRRVTQTARATRETANSAPSTPRARSRLATAPGITPVSRHQLMKAISSFVHAPRRSGRRHARTVMGRATTMKTNMTSRPPRRYLPSASNGRFRPWVTKMSRATGKATPNTGQTTSATDDHGRYEHAGQDEKAEADGGTGDHAQGDAGSAVEQDEGHPNVEEELGPDPVQWVFDNAEDGRSDQGPGRDDHDHLGEPYGRRYELGEEPGPEYEAEVAQDVLYFQPLPDQGYELLRQGSPAQVLHAVSAHDLLAPPPLLFRQLQIVG